MKTERKKSGGRDLLADEAVLEKWRGRFSHLPVETRLGIADVYARWTQQLLLSANLAEHGRDGAVFDMELATREFERLDPRGKRTLAALYANWSFALIQDSLNAPPPAGPLLLFLPLVAVGKGAS